MISTDSQNNGDEEELELGHLIADAANADDPVVAESLIRGSDFILLKQIDEDEPLPSDDEDDAEFAVVLAEMEDLDEEAVICFTTQSAADDFTQALDIDLPPGIELPALPVDGESLLNGLPVEVGLLVNPGTEDECYFPAGCFSTGAEADDE